MSVWRPDSCIMPFPQWLSTFCFEPDSHSWNPELIMFRKDRLASWDLLCLTVPELELETHRTALSLTCTLHAPSLTHVQQALLIDPGLYVSVVGMVGPKSMTRTTMSFQ